MSMQNNMAFIQLVMNALGSVRFQGFIEVLKNFRDGSITKEQIHRYVEVLFFQHPHLLAQFQTEVLHTAPSVQRYPPTSSATLAAPALTPSPVVSDAGFYAAMPQSRIVTGIQPAQ